MIFFQRSLNSNVRLRDDGRMVVESNFLDLEHSLHLTLVVDNASGKIEMAEAIMPKSPFSRCKACVEGADLLVGLTISRGIMGQINSLLGGPKSCVHLVELISEAVRLIGMLRAGDGGDYAYPGDPSHPEDVVIEKLKPQLRNSCMVFAD
jgi:hypothetical protein